ncbi:MAG TPA: DUF3040 domain-containing protein [Marmoricola sp.]|nr:DUF3040 domain-containing protein [Marmoricola sp.]
MPLSEEELRLLEQMERALVAEDPKFASTLRGTRIRQHARRALIAGVLAFIVGVALLMAGAVIPSIPLGVVGFVVMLGSAYFALTSWRGQSAAAASGAGGDTGEQGLRVIQGGKARGKSKKAKAQSHGSVMERFEERWRRRKDQNGGL